jgi:cell fate regulator YaaT (PSP1 superfamily)
MDLNIVSIRFNPVGKTYHFDATKIPDLKSGEFVVVETSRGWQLGQVVTKIENPTPPPEGTWKAIDRRATPRDLVMRQSWQAKEAEVLVKAQDRAGEMRLHGIKVVSAEYSFDGTRLTFQFSTEAEEKIELKGLRTELQKLFTPAQVELRQIGPRDVAKLMCGMGACGKELRCCSGFLTEFSSISIRMAKEQGISLTPAEITGMCGRLRCCLIYEYDHYVELRGQLPRKNKRVMTPVGEGKVIDILPLRQRVLVDIPGTGFREFAKEEVTLVQDTGSESKSAPKAEPDKQPEE